MHIMEYVYPKVAYLFTFFMFLDVRENIQVSAGRHILIVLSNPCHYLSTSTLPIKVRRSSCISEVEA